MITLKQRRQCRGELMELGLYGFCFGGKDSAETADYSSLALSTEESAKISQETALAQLDWAKQEWSEQKSMLEDIYDVQLPILQYQAEQSGKTMDAYMDMLDVQTQIAQENHQNALEDRDRYERVFQPIEDDLVQEFLSYDTEARRSMEAGRAQADVARAQDAQRKQAVQRLEDYGIDPSQTRSQALDAALRTQQASAQAAAGNSARQQVENVGRSLRGEAINIGKGLPSNVAASYQTALNAGSGAQAAGSNAMNSLNNTANSLANSSGSWTGASSAMGSPTNWMGQSNNAMSNWTSALNGQSTSALNAASLNNESSASTWGTIAGIAGTAAMFMAEGGEAIDGPGGPKDDAIPARLSDGEYVIPAEVVRRKGTEFFDKLVDKTQGEVQAKREEQAQQQKQAQARQQAMAMQAPVEHPQHLAYGGPVYPYDGPAPATGAPVYYALGGPVYDGSRGYAPRLFADGGAVAAVPKDTSYGFHGNQMSGAPGVGGTGYPLYLADGGESAAYQSAGETSQHSGTMFGYTPQYTNKQFNSANQARQSRLASTVQSALNERAWKNAGSSWYDNGSSDSNTSSTSSTSSTSGSSLSESIAAAQSARADERAAAAAAADAEAQRQAELDAEAQRQAEAEAAAQAAQAQDLQRQLAARKLYAGQSGAGGVSSNVLTTGLRANPLALGWNSPAFYGSGYSGLVNQ